MFAAGDFGEASKRSANYAGIEVTTSDIYRLTTSKSPLKQDLPILQEAF